MNDFPIITLSNGLRVGNFSSPHPFTFVDGSVLPGCTPETAQQVSLIPLEELQECYRSGVSFQQIELGFAMSAEVWDRVRAWVSLFAGKKVDLVIVPLPVLQVLPDIIKADRLFVTVRMTDRVTKQAHIDKFCI